MFKFSRSLKSTNHKGCILNKSFIAITLSALFSNAALAAIPAELSTNEAPNASAASMDPITIEQITIFGSKKAVDTLPGSGAYIDKETLNNYAVTDIQRILSSTAGVYFVEEDGYGLRPNIGMRGSSADRSEKITIMEDGVLAAPAPYASPAAYYFPTIGRMSAVEVLKGGSSIEYGPRTSGGVINLVSSAVPDEALGGTVDIALGSDGFSKVHALVGGKNDTNGGLFEVYDYRADGFKNINSGQNTGFAKTDIMGKFETYIDDNKKHHLDFKLKYSEESSDETYLGLTQQDFDNGDRFQRYSASQIDNMATEHKHASVHYDYIISENMDLSIVAYVNDFTRNWYKVSKVAGSSLGSGAEENASLFDQQVASGLAPDPLSVVVKANNRAYLSQGVQAQFAIYLDKHQINIGARIHNDEMDRFQWVDEYSLAADYSLSTISAGIPGTDSNRIDSANAFSVFVQDKMTFGDLQVTAGVRYENVNLARDDWGKTDPLRSDDAAARRNGVSALLPSVGATYQLDDNWTLLAGVQKAFAPPAPGNNNAQEEDGWNYEFGGRFAYDSLNGELIGFMTALDNLHGNCTASQGCSDDLIGQQYNAGKVDISGIEFIIGHEAKLGDLTIPTRFNFTYSSAEFAESFDSQLDVWGSVESGFEIPYLPEVMWQIETGLRGEKWQVLVAIKHVDTMRTVAGAGLITPENSIKERTVVDMSANYQIDNQQTLYAVIDNLLDKEYAATRQHGGLQVGKPRSVQLGYRYNF
ncbi:MAG: Fe(3+) dicitrate transport protein [Alphaproteobacteria bacterium]